MIEYFYETGFSLSREERYTKWLSEVVKGEGAKVKELCFIFCDDGYLLGLNKQYLRHDTYTDIITFDYVKGELISGDIFISVERVKENSIEYEVTFECELARVMVHGVLHLLQYGDKTDSEKRVMREKETEKLTMFHVEH